MQGHTFFPKTEKAEPPVSIIRGKQAEYTLKAAIIGGGQACYNLLKLLDGNRLSKMNIIILGVLDRNPEAPGMRYARELGLLTTTSIQEITNLKSLNLVIELTGSEKVREEIFDAIPRKVSIIDHRAARLIWDLIQTEKEKAELEDERQTYDRNKKSRIQVILDSLPYRIMVINLDMTVDTVNRTFLREFNRTYDEVLGNYCYAVRYGLDEPCYDCGNVCYIRDYLEEITAEKRFSTIREYIDQEGKNRYDVITISPIYNDEGEIVQFLEASREVTDRIRLEREVQESKTLFENVIRSTVDGIVVVDTKGNVLIFNEGMARLTGYRTEEIINRGHLSSFYNMDVAKENMRKMRSDDHGPVGKLNPTSMTVTSKQGEEIPVTLSASIIEIDGKEVGSVGVFTDMREFLKMRKELEEAHVQLVQSERIASVGRMAAGVAHEVNNPLAGIMIYAELLKEYLKDNKERAKDAQEIIDQTLRCKRIVSDLLEFSRQSVGKVTPFSMEDLIDKSLNILINQAIFQNIEVSSEIEKGMPHMVGDMAQLQQVLINLFINGADAMEGKGRIWVRGRFETAKNQFEIRVTDTGPGIPKELRDQIFEIFFTTKAVGKGTGLGLSISRNIVNLHGGNITLECPPEGGTTFVIELPLGFVETPVEEPLFIGLDE